MQYLRVLALCYLVAFLAFFFGYMVRTSKMWPHQLISDTAQFVRGEQNERSSLAEKIGNDFGLAPSRFYHDLIQQPTASSKTVTLPESIFRARKKQPFVSKTNSRGYWAIHGTFDFKKNFHGTILINEKGELKRYWSTPIREDLTPQGFELLQDGTLMANMGSYLATYDWCGKQLWKTPLMSVHHSIKGTEKHGVWTWGLDNSLVQFHPKSGKIKKTIQFEDIIAANPNYYGFEITSQYGGWQFADWKGFQGREKYENFHGDPFHPNAINPLPEALAAAFPMFTPGDLLISLRTLNLLLVVDPHSLKVKWYSQGQVSRQHDPEWTPWGTISVYNNRMHYKTSNIEEIAIADKAQKVVIDGRDHLKFKAITHGDHQVLKDGARLVVLPHQGRMIHFAKNGEIMFEFINRYDENHVFEIQNALFIESEVFDSLESHCQQAD